MKSLASEAPLTPSPPAERTGMDVDDESDSYSQRRPPQDQAKGLPLLSVLSVL